MKKQNTLWHVSILGMIGAVMMSCSLPAVGLSRSTQTPTPQAGSISGGGLGNNAGGGQKQGNGNGSNNGNGQNNDNNQNSSTPVPTPIDTPAPGAPYLVKQSVHQGDETVSGEVCSLANPFTVNMVTTKITFNIGFVPSSASQGVWTYAYSFPSLGETHDAKGSYLVSQAGTDGTLLLTMKGADHVVFKGFDGNMPVNYPFNLVPSTHTACPNN